MAAVSFARKAVRMMLLQSKRPTFECFSEKQRERARLEIPLECNDVNG